MHGSVEATHAQVVELLMLQADAITRVTHWLQPAHVERAVGLLATCQDKVILIGTGKSGIVARKIAATLTNMVPLAKLETVLQQVLSVRAGFATAPPVSL